jgi:hypothetical protein
MSPLRAFATTALLVLNGMLADPVRAQCPADDAIPEFVTRRVELVRVAPTGTATDAPAVEVGREPACDRGVGIAQ